MGLVVSSVHAAPVNIYRGAGRPEAALLMETLVDEAARHARIDPVEYQARERQAKQQADAAQSQVEIAQKQYDNNKALVDQGFISRTALETSASSTAGAEAPLQAALGPAWRLQAEPMFSQIGSGALPGGILPSHGLVARPATARRSDGWTGAASGAAGGMGLVPLEDGLQRTIAYFKPRV